MSRGLVLTIGVLVVIALSPVFGAEVGDDLRKAAEQGDLKKIEALLQGGASLNAKDKKGRSALHYAAQKEQVAAVRSLLTAGADRRLKDREGFTPVALVRMKLPNRAGPRWDEAMAKLTPLIDVLDIHAAARNGNAEAVRFNLSIGEKTESRNSQGQTVLMAAAAGGRLEMLDLLIAEKADVDAQALVRRVYGKMLGSETSGFLYELRPEPAGPPVIAIAAAAGQVEAVKRLVTAGANRNVSFVCRAVDMRVPGFDAATVDAQVESGRIVEIMFSEREKFSAYKNSTTGGVHIQHWLKPQDEETCTLLSHVAALGKDEIVKLLTPR